MLTFLNHNTGDHVSYTMLTFGYMVFGLLAQQTSYQHNVM